MRVVVAVLTAALAAVVGLSASRSDAVALVSVRILALNDLHGAIGDAERPSAAYLASQLRAHGLGQPGTLLVGAGDLVGASPPVSALLLDEPTVRVLNAMGMVATAPGNHDFDRGVAEMFRLTNGGCGPTTGCFEGASYRAIAANVFDAATLQPVLPAYHLVVVSGQTVAFVGAVAPDLPSETAVGATRGLVITDPAVAVNDAVRDLQAQGVHAFVVLIHQGGVVDRATGALTGPIAATVDALDPDVDLVVSAHTHQGYVVRRAGKLVTQAYASGTAFVEADLLLDPASDEVAEATARIVASRGDVQPDPDVRAIVEDADARVRPLTQRLVGTAAAPVSRSTNTAGESALGDLVADAFRWRMGTQIGLTNAGGLRASLPAGDITWGQAFAALPLGNTVVSLTLPGDQLYSLFESQWTLEADGSERFHPLQVSGLRVTWDARQPRGKRIVTLTLEDGRAVDPRETYSLAVNDYLAGGPPPYSPLLEASARQAGPSDLDSLIEFIAQLPQPFRAGVEGRISRLG